MKTLILTDADFDADGKYNGSILSEYFDGDISLNVKNDRIYSFDRIHCKNINFGSVTATVNVIKADEIDGVAGLNVKGVTEAKNIQMKSFTTGYLKDCQTVVTHHLQVERDCICANNSTIESSYTYIKGVAKVGKIKTMVLMVDGSLSAHHVKAKSMKCENVEIFNSL